MKRYFSLVWLHFKYSLLKDMEYKFNFIFGGMFELVWLAMYIVFINVIYGNVDTLAGWTKYQTLFLTFQGGLMDSVFTFLLVPGLGQLPNHIRLGTLDMLLLKPISKRFYVSINELYIPEIKNVLINVIGIVYCIHKLKIQLSALQVLGYIWLTINGFIVIYCMMFTIMTLAFWVVKLDIVLSVGSQFITLGNKPPKIYPRILGKIFIYVIPVFVVFNIPVQFALSKISWGHLLIGTGIMLIWVAFSQILFRKGLKKYVSTNS